MIRLRWFLMVCLIGAAAPCRGGIVTQKQNAASLNVEFEGKKQQLTLADLLIVTLTIDGDADLRVQAPLKLPAESPWMLVSRTEAVREPLEKDRVRWKLIYRFGPREPGEKVNFTFPDVKFYNKDGKQQTVQWDPIPFAVITQIANPELGILRDITSIESLPSVHRPDYSLLLWTTAAVISLLAITVALGMRTLFRRKRPRSAAQLALYEWQRLIAMKLSENDHGKRFITLLTAIVRRYLEREFALPARRQTTPEFLQSLEACAVLTPAEKQFLKAFLQRCDAVKFAHWQMPPDECDRWAREVRQFLQQHIRA